MPTFQEDFERLFEVARRIMRIRSLTLTFMEFANRVRFEVEVSRRFSTSPEGWIRAAEEVVGHYQAELNDEIDSLSDGGREHGECDLYKPFLGVDR